MQIDAAWAAQMMRSHAGLLAGGNAKWLLEDLLYGVPLEAQQRIEARIAADGGTRTFFQLACDWVELARGEADVLAFVEAALRGAGADVTIERPPVPPPPPAAVIRRVAPRPTTIVLDEVSEMVAVDGFDPPRVLATGPGEAAVPRDGLVCVRPIRFLSMAETAAWLGAMTAPIGVGLRNTAPSAEALTALGEHGGLEVLYLPHTPRGLEGLHGLPHLALASPAALDDAAVAWLRSLPALRAIDLGDVAEPIGRLADLTGFTHVSALRLGMWSAVEQAAVASWPSLVSIDLGPVEEPVTAETLAPLAALPRLARLRLPGVHEDDEIAALARALPPRVRVIA